MSATVTPDEPTAGSPETPELKPARFRAFLVGLFLACFVCYAVANQPTSGIFSLMVPPIGATLLMVLVNAVLRNVAPKWAFTTADLVIIYSINAVAGAAAAEWVSVTNWAIFGYPLKPTDATTRDYLIKHVPDWLVIKDLAEVEEIRGGGRELSYVLTRIHIFLPRWLAWSALFISLGLAMLCINSLMRGAWCRRERLAFPLIQLPVAITEKAGAGPIWKSRYMWIAFALMFAIDMLNGFNYLYPNVPSVPVKTLFQVNEVFKEPPWSNIGDFRISIFPFMAAIGLFMPSDLLFSFVAFFLLRKLSHVALASYGIPQSTFSGTSLAPGPPYFDEQTWGGIFAMFLGAMWVSKDYLREVWRDIRSGARSDDGGVTHRWAFIGLMVSFFVVVFFGYLGDIPVLLMVPYVAAFLIFSIVLTRLRAQLGPPTHEFAFFGPTSLFNRFIGTRWMSDAQATYISQVFLWMNRIYRTHPMPHQLEAMKMGQIQNMRQKPIFIGALAALILGFFLACLFYTAATYRTGDLGWTGVEVYVSNLTKERTGPSIIGIIMTIFGFSLVMLLDAIRFRFPAFPLHPAGYVLSMNFGVDYYWFGLLLALLVKNFVQRYYGLRGYDKLRSVALGILLAEYTAELIWMTMALVTRQSTYTISFNDRSLGAQ